ncbi:MAG: ParB/RepB/Spo0J family partition protein [Nitrosomonas sp.]|nr:ParB/RepB/Spo0J family partition protein [Nitrosomonas sp.]
MTEEHENETSKSAKVHTLNEMELDSIIEDPNQPRKVFDPASLEELANTIKTRGVKTPISVRPNPDKSGTYIINHGARRYRASRIAGKKTIPTFIDHDYTEIDQVIENIQRDNLSSREVADFIGQQLSAGKKNNEIAIMIGKSKAYVSQHTTLLDLPPVISDLVNNGRINDLGGINELVKIYRQFPDEVTRWVSDENTELTRAAILLMRDCLIDMQHQRLSKDPVENAVFLPKTKPGRQSKNKKEAKQKIELHALVVNIAEKVGTDDKSDAIFDHLSPGEQKQLQRLLQKVLNVVLLQESIK